MLAKILHKLIGTAARGMAVLLAFALLAPALLVLYTTSDDFRTRLLARLEPELDGRMAGDLSIGGLEGSPLRALRFENAVLSWHGEAIARIASVAVELDWSALLFGRFRIAQVEREGVELVLREHASLGWDWREALAPLIRAPDDPRPARDEPVPLVIETILLSQGRLQIAPIARTAVQLEGIDLRGRVDFIEKRFTLEQASLASGDSKLTASGVAPFKGRYVFDVVVESLHPRYLALINPTLADTLSQLSPASGSLVLSGGKDALDASGQLAWPGTKLDFDAHGDPSELTLARSTLAARLESRDLARFLPALALAGQLDLQLDLQLEMAGGEGKLGAKLRQAPRGELEANGVLSLAGRGRDRESLAGSISLDLESSRIGALKLRRGRLRAKLERALVTADLALSDFRLGDFRSERARLVFAARGGLMGESAQGVIETLRFETLLAAWRLEKASRIHASRESLDLESARFSSGEAVILLDGHLARHGRQDFRLEARALPVAAWARAFPDRVSPEILTGGVLDLDLSVGGTAAAPILDARLVPHGLVLAEKSIEKAEATLRFAARRARAKLSASASPSLRLDAEAEIPFELA